jgi:hypothetical protein
MNRYKQLLSLLGLVPSAAKAALPLAAQKLSQVPSSFNLSNPVPQMPQSSSMGAAPCPMGRLRRLDRAQRALLGPWQRSEVSPQLVSPERNLGLLPKVSEQEIGDGLSGNIQTIDLMKQVARLRAGDPLLRKLSLNILQEAGVPSHHFVGEALAIGQYVKNNMRYVRDPDGIEYLQDPLDMVKNIQNRTAQGDSEDMALLVATLLLSIGHQPYYRAVRYNSTTGNYNHIYVVAYERDPYQQNQRIVLDCIMKDKPIGYEVQQANGDEYPI